MEERRALRLLNLLRLNRSEKKTCCYKHLLFLLKDSVGMPFATLTHVNFLQCLDCRPPAPLSGDCSSSALLDSFFLEYSIEVASRASKRARSGCSTHDAEYRDRNESDNGDCGDGHALIRAPGGTSSSEPIPHHVLLGDGVLSYVPLCDILRARFVSRTWMNSINAFLQNPRPHVHPYLRRPCLMLLHPASTKTGARASLAVFDFSLNSWLPKPIVFPGNASFLVGASDGLFCCATGNPEIDDDVDFFVGNPLFGIWTRLPHLPQAKSSHYDTTVSMAFVVHVVSQDSPGGLVYKLLRLEYWEEESCCSIKFLMYDSCTLEWKNRVNTCRERLGSVRPNDIVVDDSGLVRWFCRSGYVFWSYDMHTKKSRWGYYAEMGHDVHQLVTDGRLGVSFGLPSVLWCAGTFFIVYRMWDRMQRQGVEDAAVGLIPVVLQFCQIRIVRLEHDSSRQIPVSIVPPNLLKQAVEEGSDGTDFVIGTDRTRRIFFILRGSSKMLVYDVLSSIWETLPGCPIGLSFYPYKLRAFFEPLL